MSRIFVSYATSDVDVVEATIAHAEAIAPDLTFFRASDPDSLIPGVKWRERILLEMDRADLAIFFVSPESIGRAWLNFELGYIEKSIGTSVICVTIKQPDIGTSGGPVVAHHLLPLSPVAKLAAEELLRFVRSYIPVEKQGSRKNAIQIGAKLYPLEQGWQRYVSGGTAKSDIRTNAFGIAFGKTFDDDGFRYPSSQDSLQAPWECLVLRANPDLAVNVYFVTEMIDGSSIKLYVNSAQDSIGFVGVPKNEFQIPVPPRDRSPIMIIDTRSFLPRLGMEPRGVKGLRVRGPTELSYVGMFESTAAVPARFRRKRDSIEIVLP